MIAHSLTVSHRFHPVWDIIRNTPRTRIYQIQIQPQHADIAQAPEDLSLRSLFGNLVPRLALAVLARLLFGRDSLARNHRATSTARETPVLLRRTGHRSSNSTTSAGGNSDSPK